MAKMKYHKLTAILLAAIFVFGCSNKAGQAIYFHDGEVNSQNERTKGIAFPYGTVEHTKQWDGAKGLTYDIFRTRGDDASSRLFEFLATNTSVEWSQVKLGISGDSGLNYLTTSHETGKEKAMTHLINSQLLHGYTFREHVHSHPGNTDHPSGFPKNNDVNNTGDIRFARKLTSSLGYDIHFYIFIPKSGNYVRYTPESTKEDFIPMQSYPTIEPAIIR